MRLLYLIVPNCVSNLLEIVEVHRIDPQHDDDNVEVHFLTWRLPLNCECVSASSLLQLETVSVSELRVPELDSM